MLKRLHILRRFIPADAASRAAKAATASSAVILSPPDKPFQEEHQRINIEGKKHNSVHDNKEPKHKIFQKSSSSSSQGSSFFCPDDAALCVSSTPSFSSLSLSASKKISIQHTQSNEFKRNININIKNNNYYYNPNKKESHNKHHCSSVDSNEANSIISVPSAIKMHMPDNAPFHFNRDKFVYMLNQPLNKCTPEEVTMFSTHLRRLTFYGTNFERRHAQRSFAHFLATAHLGWDPIEGTGCLQNENRKKENEREGLKMKSNYISKEEEDENKLLSSFSPPLEVEDEAVVEDMGWVTPAMAEALLNMVTTYKSKMFEIPPLFGVCFHVIAENIAQRLMGAELEIFSSMDPKTAKYQLKTSRQAEENVHDVELQQHQTMYEAEKQPLKRKIISMEGFDKMLSRLLLVVGRAESIKIYTVLESIFKLLDKAMMTNINENDNNETNYFQETNSDASTNKSFDVLTSNFSVSSKLIKCVSLSIQCYADMNLSKYHKIWFSLLKSLYRSISCLSKNNTIAHLEALSVILMSLGGLNECLLNRFVKLNSNSVSSMCLYLPAEEFDTETKNLEKHKRGFAKDLKGSTIITHDNLMKNNHNIDNNVPITLNDKRNTTLKSSSLSYPVGYSMLLEPCLYYSLLCLLCEHITPKLPLMKTGQISYFLLTLCELVNDPKVAYQKTGKSVFLLNKKDCDTTEGHINSNSNAAIVNGDTNATVIASFMNTRMNSDDAISGALTSIISKTITVGFLINALSLVFDRLTAISSVFVPGEGADIIENVCFLLSHLNAFALAKLGSSEYRDNDSSTDNNAVDERDFADLEYELATMSYCAIYWINGCVWPNMNISHFTKITTMDDCVIKRIPVLRDCFLLINGFQRLGIQDAPELMLWAHGLQQNRCIGLVKSVKYCVIDVHDTTISDQNAINNSNTLVHAPGNGTAPVKDDENNILSNDITEDINGSNSGNVGQRKMISFDDPYRCELTCLECKDLDLQQSVRGATSDFFIFKRLLINKNDGDHNNNTRNENNNVDVDDLTPMRYLEQQRILAAISAGQIFVRQPFLVEKPTNRNTKILIDDHINNIKDKEKGSSLSLISKALPMNNDKKDSFVVANVSKINDSSNERRLISNCFVSSILLLPRNCLLNPRWFVSATKHTIPTYSVTRDPYVICRAVRNAFYNDIGNGLRYFILITTFVWTILYSDEYSSTTPLIFTYGKDDDFVQKKVENVMKSFSDLKAFALVSESVHWDAMITSPEIAIFSLISIMAEVTRAREMLVNRNRKPENQLYGNAFSKDGVLSFFNIYEESFEIAAALLLKPELLEVLENWGGMLDMSDSSKTGNEATLSSPIDASNQLILYHRKRPMNSFDFIKEKPKNYFTDEYLCEVLIDSLMWPRNNPLGNEVIKILLNIFEKRVSFIEDSLLSRTICRLIPAAVAGDVTCLEASSVLTASFVMLIFEESERRMRYFFETGELRVLTRMAMLRLIGVDICAPGEEVLDPETIGEESERQKVEEENVKESISEKNKKWGADDEECRHVDVMGRVDDVSSGSHLIAKRMLKRENFEVKNHQQKKQEQREQKVVVIRAIDGKNDEFVERLTLVYLPKILKRCTVSCNLFVRVAEEGDALFRRLILRENNKKWRAITEIAGIDIININKEKEIPNKETRRVMRANNRKNDINNDESNNSSMEENYYYYQDPSDARMNQLETARQKFHNLSLSLFERELCHSPYYQAAECIKLLRAFGVRDKASIHNFGKKSVTVTDKMRFKMTENFIDVYRQKCNGFLDIWKPHGKFISLSLFFDAIAGIHPVQYALFFDTFSYLIPDILEDTTVTIFSYNMYELACFCSKFSIRHMVHLLKSICEAKNLSATFSMNDVIAVMNLAKHIHVTEQLRFNLMKRLKSIFHFLGYGELQLMDVASVSITSKQAVVSLFERWLTCAFSTQIRRVENKKVWNMLLEGGPAALDLIRHRNVENVINSRFISYFWVSAAITPGTCQCIDFAKDIGLRWYISTCDIIRGLASLDSFNTDDMMDIYRDKWVKYKSDLNLIDDSLNFPLRSFVRMLISVEENSEKWEGKKCEDKDITSFYEKIEDSHSITSLYNGSHYGSNIIRKAAPVRVPVTKVALAILLPRHLSVFWGCGSITASARNDIITRFSNFALKEGVWGKSWRAGVKKDPTTTKGDEKMKGTSVTERVEKDAKATSVSHTDGCSKKLKKQDAFNGIGILSHVDDVANDETTEYVRGVKSTSSYIAENKEEEQVPFEAFAYCYFFSKIFNVYVKSGAGEKLVVEDARRIVHNEAAHIKAKKELEYLRQLRNKAIAEETMNQEKVPQKGIVDVVKIVEAPIMNGLNQRMASLLDNKTCVKEDEVTTIKATLSTSTELRGKGVEKVNNYETYTHLPTSIVTMQNMKNNASKVMAKMVSSESLSPDSKPPLADRALSTMAQFEQEYKVWVTAHAPNCQQEKLSIHLKWSWCDPGHVLRIATPKDLPIHVSDIRGWADILPNWRIACSQEVELTLQLLRDRAKYGENAHYNDWVNESRRRRLVSIDLYGLCYYCLFIANSDGKRLRLTPAAEVIKEFLEAWDFTLPSLSGIGVRRFDTAILGTGLPEVHIHPWFSDLSQHVIKYIAHMPIDAVSQTLLQMSDVIAFIKVLPNLHFSEEKISDLMRKVVARLSDLVSCSSPTQLHDLLSFFTSEVHHNLLINCNKSAQQDIMAILSCVPSYIINDLNEYTSENLIEICTMLSKLKLLSTEAVVAMVKKIIKDASKDPEAWLPAKTFYTIAFAKKLQFIKEETVSKLEALETI